MDNLDKVIWMYSCRGMTARWPLVVFHNIGHISSYNALVLWRETNPDWIPCKWNQRRVFLEYLGMALLTPLIKRKECLPQTEASTVVVRASQRAGTFELPKDPSAALAATIPAVTSKRKRCHICPPKKDCKTHTVCGRCRKYIFKGCSLAF